MRELSKQTEDGVYYDNFLGLVTVRIVGCCPSLDSDGNCLIYRGRRLSDCETMDIGSDNCVLLRRAYEQGLKINT